jgi:hypothetical protein
MVNPNDSIRFTNVISRKYRFHYNDMQKALEDFINDVMKLNVILKGPLFYSINNVPIDELLNVEFFTSVKNDKVSLMEDMSFHSYFSIENMISYCLFSNFESNTEVAYRILIDYMEQNNLKQVTPIFHVLSGNHTMQYAFIKIGVSNDSNKNNNGFE